MKYDPILYDADPRPFLKEEVNFYQKLVDKFGSKTILELGVGTGRIFSKLLPIVDFGVGIDISKLMLDECQKACSSFDNYQLAELSFVDFDLSRTFDLIYLPFNTFQHLLTEEDQIKCLVSIKKHLNNDSWFILDLMNGDGLTFDFENWKQEYSAILPSGNRLEREQKTIEVNKETSIIHKIFRYKEMDGKGKVFNVSEFEAFMKINPNEKIRELLEKSGFEIKDVWSDYSFGHSTESKKMIYCLKVHEI